MIIDCWILAILNTLVYLLSLCFKDAAFFQPYFWHSCDFYVDPLWLGWVFSPTTCDRGMYWHCAISCTDSIFILVGFNLATLYAMHQANNK